VKNLAADLLEGENRGVVQRPTRTASELWKAEYLPVIERDLRPSTVESYKQLWSKHIEPEFGHRTMSDVRSSDVTKFLTRIAPTMGRHTLTHLKNVGIALWSHAEAIGEVESNVWRAAKSLTKPKPSSETKFYTLEHAQAVLNACASNPVAQTAFALAFFAGLRTGEIRGIRWEDLGPDFEYAFVERAVVRNKIGPVKTEASRGKITLAAPLRSLLKIVHQSQMSPVSGWVLPNGRNRPADLREMGRRTIAPLCEKAEVAWLGFQSARRGCATLITNLAGPQAAQQQLRHKSMGVTFQKYIKDDRQAANLAIALLDTKLK